MRNSSLSAVGRIGDRAVLVARDAAVHEQGGVATVVEDEVRLLIARPVERLEGAPPVLGERLALPRVDGGALRVVGSPVRADDDRGGRVILRREDVAARPAHFGAEGDERLDEDRGLDRHVKRTGDPRTLERLLAGVLLAERHEAGHLVLGEFDLLATVRHGLGREIRDLVRQVGEERQIGVEERGVGDSGHEVAPEEVRGNRISRPRDGRPTRYRRDRGRPPALPAASSVDPDERMKNRQGVPARSSEGSGNERTAPGRATRGRGPMSIRLDANAWPETGPKSRFLLRPANAGLTPPSPHGASTSPCGLSPTGGRGKGGRVVRGLARSAR